MRRSAQVVTKMIRKTVDLNFNNMFSLLMPVAKTAAGLHPSAGRESIISRRAIRNLKRRASRFWLPRDAHPSENNPQFRKTEIVI